MSSAERGRRDEVLERIARPREARFVEGHVELPERQGAWAGLEADLGDPKMLALVDPLHELRRAGRSVPGVRGRKGVRVALLDLNADGAPEIFAVPGGSDATCHVFDGTTFAEIQTFTPLDSKGAFVAAGR
jgi:hypothetical protein